MASTHLPPNWITRLLQVVGAPATAQNQRLMHAWARAEGGNAKWNPLNSTFDLPGATDYNSIHVKNYPRATWGICALALTLTQGDYNGILGDLQAATKTAEQIVKDRRAQFSHWGTDVDLLLEVLNEI